MRFLLESLVETSSLKHYTYFLFKNFILLHYVLHFGGEG